MEFLRTLATLIFNIGLRDVLDIACVAACFFLLFALLRASRSVLALRSLVLLMSFSIGTYFLARLIDLSALTLLFSQFWSVIIIIYLIVFQGAFRRAFQEIGQFRLVRALIRPKSAHLRTLARAVMRLSEKQLGALFVLQRRTDVGPTLVSPGVEIDAVLTEELIISIFFSYTPLHDGAVIIENERLARANCTLPISRSANIPKGLGTRHRAAIEITELTDAVAVVVSEETGAVSVVHGGVIDRGLDEDQLLRALEKLMNVRLSNAGEGGNE